MGQGNVFYTCLSFCSLVGSVDICLGGLCLEGSLSRGGLCPRGFCLEGEGVSVQGEGVSVQGSSGSSSRVRRGWAEKHEIYAATFGSQLFYDFFHRTREAPESATARGSPSRGGGVSVQGGGGLCPWVVSVKRGSLSGGKSLSGGVSVKENPPYGKEKSGR